MVTCANDKITRIWNEKGEILNIMQQTHNQMSVRWNKSGSAFATAGFDKHSTIFDAQSLKHV